MKRTPVRPKAFERQDFRLWSWAAVAVAACVAVPSLSLAAGGRDMGTIDPPFPRIANCYGSGLGWQTWDKGAEYWSKLDLFIGGGYDLHYDWDDPRWTKILATIEDNVRHLREANPNALVLPYVDVVEGPDNPAIPKAWWDLRDGKHWSGWPGYDRINTALPDVLEYNLAKVRAEVLGRDVFDGVFYDCWHPDPWLVPRTAALRDGHAVVMVNDWNLPTTGFADLNGCLAEDEVNRVIEGQVDFEDLLARYLEWTRESRKPAVTTLVCHPRGLDMDEWRWDKVDWRERMKIADDLRTSDLQTMRFGLATALMGDGYFAYDCANLGRGQWWWYPEYDAPLGHPRGPAHHNADGTWQREFSGGLVVVNGTLYDAVVQTPRTMRDLSTARVGRRFTLRMYDGRILLPTDAAPTAQPDVAPRLTATPPKSARAVSLDEEGQVVVQTPGGLELRFAATGELRNILFGGRTVLVGGWPIAASPPWKYFSPTDVTHKQAVEPRQATVTFSGTLVQGDQRVAFVETCSAEEPGRFTLRFDFAADTDLDLRMWRHYFFLPVKAYAGATVTSDAGKLKLPAELGTAEELVPATTRLTVTRPDLSATITSSAPMSLIDHRKYGTPDYLLAAYPVGGEVKQGTTWSIEMTVDVTRSGRQ